MAQFGFCCLEKLLVTLFCSVSGNIQIVGVIHSRTKCTLISEEIFGYFHQSVINEYEPNVSQVHFSITMSTDISIICFLVLMYISDISADIFSDHSS